MKKLLLTAICVFSIYVILNFPETVTDGVRQGIQLNLYSVIPALLPFIVLTNIMMKYNLCECIGFIFYPLLSKIFNFSKNGCFAAIIGFTCGYPMGAKIIGDLHKNKLICDSEAKYLITFCNNCSVSFLLNYIAFKCIVSSFPTKKLILLVYLPSLITGFVNKFFIKSDMHIPSNNMYNTNWGNPITNAVKSISTLCVYIICFTVISKYIASLNFLSNNIKCIFSGLFEITSGTDFISSNLENIALKNFLILLSTVFGGFSIMFQSFASLSERFLKKYYIIGKIEQIIIFCILYVVFI